jgi:lantibiotic biosynthesis protein
MSRDAHDPMRRSADPASPCLAAAVEIGARLVDSALSRETGVTWEGDDLIGDDEASARAVRGPVGPNLYGGTAGIAWFLGHLAAKTALPAFAEVSAAGLEFALAESFRGVEEGRLSLYSGATGVALAAAEVAGRLGNRAMSGKARALAHEIARQVRNGNGPHEHDLIGGSAGVAVGLIGLNRRFGDNALLEAALQLCRGLVDQAEAGWWGACWQDHHTPGLCGLAHGASGVAWALAETAWATGEADLLEVARAAFRYEAAWFSQQHCAWPDLRQGQGTSWTTAWCHGALGIGAVRLRFFEATGEESALAEASAAIQAARSLVVHAGRELTDGNPTDASLCHGLGGAIELILLAGEILGPAEHGRAARRIAELCLRIRGTNGNRWTNGLRGTSDVPGLFLGEAGIGVTMLRVDDPASIGSPLLAGRPACTARRAGLA